ncbi:retrovirus-related pol polyprotein from transposon TNT 1-94 [Tanacetum coccineum]
MGLYMKNKEHGRMILESVEHGPLIWPTIEENGVTRTKKYEELSATKKIQADCDLKATNIILQGLPSDVYSLVSHHRVAKDLWERVQLLMQGTSLTKQERECKLYDVFDKFAHIKGESLHQYYLRFTQLINDMNIYKMKLEQLQVNTMFLNNLPLEWSKFVIDVKLVSDLHTTNFDQLHAYLEQHELHANKVRIIRERNQDPLALVANHQMTPSHFNTYQSLYNNPQFQQHFSPSQSPQYRSNHPTQHYSTTYQSTPHVITYPSTPHTNAYSSTGRQSSIAAGTSRTRANISRTCGNNSGQQRVVKCFNCQGEGHMARQCPKPKRKRDATWFRDKVLLVEAQGSAYQADDLDAYDSDCDDFSTAKAVLMANLSSYGSNVLSEVPHSENTHNDMLNQSVQEMTYSEQTHLVNYPENEITSDSNIIHYSQYLHETQNAAVQDINSSPQQDVTREKMIDSQMDDMIKEKFALKQQIDSLEQNLSNQIKEKESLLQTFTVFKNESKEKESKYMDKEIDLEKKIKELDNIVYKVGQSAQTMHIPVFDDDETLILEELQTSHPNTDQSASSPIKIEAPRELPKVSLVNTSLKKLKYHLGQFDTMVKKRITPDALTKGEWGFEHTKSVFLKEIIPILKTLKDTFNVFDKDLLNEVTEVQTLFNQMEAVVQQYFVDKQCFKIHKKELFLENDRLLQKFMSQDVMNILKAELQAKDTTTEKLKANIKRLNKISTTNSVKKDIDEIESINIELEHRVTKLIAKNEHSKQTYKQLYDSIKPSRKGMYKLDPVTLAPKDKNNRETHIYYLKHTMEQAVILREIVKQSKSLNPLDSASYSACNSMFDARHELCFLEFVYDMNASSKSKSVKKAKKKEEWKPTRKVFTKIGYY